MSDYLDHFDSEPLDPPDEPPNPENSQRRLTRTVPIELTLTEISDLQHDKVPTSLKSRLPYVPEYGETFWHVMSDTGKKYKYTRISNQSFSTTYLTDFARNKEFLVLDHEDGTIGWMNAIDIANLEPLTKDNPF